MITGKNGKRKGGTPIRLRNGKIVGTLYQECGAADFAVADRHRLNMAGGFSLSAEVVEELKRLNIRLIEFRHTKRKQTYRISLDKFLTHARSYDFGGGVKLATHERHYQDDSADDLLPGMIVPPAQGYSAQAGA